MPLPNPSPNSKSMLFPINFIFQFQSQHFPPFFSHFKPLFFLPLSSLYSPLPNLTYYAIALPNSYLLFLLSEMDGEGNKKLRKPYTITKSRDRWSEEEHERFLDGLLLFGREWKKIEDFVGTKTVIQIRSHAQKYFLKVQKNGLMVHVPPPRPKRNHTYPYPRESSEDDMLPIQTSMICPSPSSYFTPNASWEDNSMLMDYISNNDSMSTEPGASLAGFEGDTGLGMDMYNRKFEWSGSTNRSLAIHDGNEQGNQQHRYPVIPNFAEVYNLIATMIDPEIANSFGMYMQKLKEMDPITAKTALVLVKNLTINLSSAEFVPFSRFLLACDANSKANPEMSDASVATAPEMYNTGFLPIP